MQKQRAGSRFQSLMGALPEKCLRYSEGNIAAIGLFLLFTSGLLVSCRRVKDRPRCTQTVQPDGRSLLTDAELYLLTPILPLTF